VPWRQVGRHTSSPATRGGSAQDRRASRRAQVGEMGLPAFRTQLTHEKHLLLLHQPPARDFGKESHAPTMHQGCDIQVKWAAVCSLSASSSSGSPYSAPVDAEARDTRSRKPFVVRSAAVRRRSHGSADAPHFETVGRQCGRQLATVGPSRALSKTRNRRSEHVCPRSSGDRASVS
jgi:hypothetical protein